MTRVARYPGASVDGCWGESGVEGVGVDVTAALRRKWTVRAAWAAMPTPKISTTDHSWRKAATTAAKAVPATSRPRRALTELTGVPFSAPFRTGTGPDHPS